MLLMCAQIHVPECHRLSRVHNRVGPAPRHVQQARRQRGQRQQIEPVVLEHRFERRRIAAAEELEVPPGNLESRHVAVAPGTDDLTFERHQRAAGLCARVEHGRTACWRTSPESPRGVQHVHVRELAAAPWHPVEEVPPLEQRRVE